MLLRSIEEPGQFNLFPSLRASHSHIGHPKSLANAIDIACDSAIPRNGSISLLPPRISAMPRLPPYYTFPRETCEGKDLDKKRAPDNTFRSAGSVVNPYII